MLQSWCSDSGMTSGQLAVVEPGPRMSGAQGPALSPFLPSGLLSPL